MKVNRPGTEGALGGIDGRTLVYQEYVGHPWGYEPSRFSRIVLYDLETGKRTVPPAVNGPDWEYRPSIWGPWILYATLDRNGDRHVLGFNFDTRGDADFGGPVTYLQPGQVNEGIFTWVSFNRGRRARVLVYDLERGLVYPLPSRRWQWAPSVGPQRSVYVLETGRRCGSSPVVKRYDRGMQGGYTTPGKEVLRLPNGFDASTSFGYAGAKGTAEVVHQRLKCGSGWGSDIYRFTDDATLTVATDGMGSGTVASHEPGIDCGEDCTEIVSAGVWVTLIPEAGFASRFAGWSRECFAEDPGTNSCTLQIDAATEITATFDVSP